MRQQVNLYHAFVTPPVRLPARHIALISAILLLLMVIYGSYLNWQAGQVTEQVTQREQALAQMNTHIRELDADLQQRRPSAALQQRVSQREAALQYRRLQLGALDGGLMGQRIGYSAFLTALARQHQQGLWLTGIQLRYGQRQVMIEGRSVSGALVPQWLEGFAEEAALASQSFAEFSIGSEAPEQDQAGLLFRVQSACDECPADGYQEVDE